LHILVNATVRGGTEITKTPADLKTNDRERIFLVKKKEKVAISERLLLRQFYPPSFFYPALRFFTPQNYKGAGENNKGGKNGDLPRAAGQVGQRSVR
jgi:hypothetical protein